MLEHLISQHAPDDKLDGGASGDDDDDGKDQLDLRQTALAFLIWGAVTVVALALFAAEVLAGENSRRRRRRKRVDEEGEKRKVVVVVY